MGGGLFDPNEFRSGVNGLCLCLKYYLGKVMGDIPQQILLGI